MRIDDTSSVELGSAFRLRVAYWHEATVGTVLATFDPWEPENAAMMPRPDAEEEFDNLNAATTRGRFAPQVIGRESVFIRMEGAIHGAGDDWPSAPVGGSLDQGGADDPLELGVADYLGRRGPHCP